MGRGGQLDIGMVVREACLMGQQVHDLDPVLAALGEFRDMLATGP